MRSAHTGRIPARNWSRCSPRTWSRDYRCVNHEPDNDDACVAFGTTRTGAPALINRHLVEADVRIITGFIEPHFFAGFSGGPKGIMPGVAALKTVQSNHGAHNIGDRRATFGVTEGNPIWEEMRDIALRIGPSFLLNVALNQQRQITGVFAGDLIAAHRVGTEFVRAGAMQNVPGLFDIVITTNSGYPLDMNVYQSGKGMRAAELIVRDGGLIIMAAECSEGMPAGQPARPPAPQRAEWRSVARQARRARLHLRRAMGGTNPGAHPAPRGSAFAQRARRGHGARRASHPLPRYRRRRADAPASRTRASRCCRRGR